MSSKIVSVRKVANGSLQAEMVGTVSVPGRVNVLAELNKGDDRFNTGKGRRAWFPVTEAGLAELGASSEQLEAISKLSESEKYALEIDSPKVNGEELCIQVTEFINPGQYESENTMKAAKKIAITDSVAKNQGINTSYDLSKYIGQDGFFLDADGNHIFSRTTVTIKSQLRHKFVAGEMVPEKELASFGATLAPAREVTEKVGA